MATTSDAGTTRPASGHVDWDLAKSSARRLVPAGPRVSAREAADVVASLRSAAQRAAAPVAETARLHAPAGSSPVLVVDRAGWIDANVDSLRDMLEPVIDTMLDKHRRTAPGAGLGQTHRQQDHRRRGGRAAGVPGRQGARPVRPRAGRPAPAAAGGAQHRARRARAGGRPPTTSGSGCACTRRPTGCSSPRSRGCATHLVDAGPRAGSSAWRPTPSSSAASSQQLAAQRCPEAAAQRRRRGLARRCSRPRSSGRSIGRADRGDVAARGPRRRGDGRRGPPGHPHGGGDPGEVPAAPPGAARRPAAAPAARPRGQDAPVPRRRALRPGGHRHGRHRRVQRRLDLPGDPAAAGGDRASPRCGSRRVHG